MALLSHASAGGRATAESLWASLPLVSEREWIRLPADAFPVVPTEGQDTHTLNGVIVSHWARIAMQLASFLAHHYEDHRIETGHVAVALAGLPNPAARIDAMQSAADAYFDAELVSLHLLIEQYWDRPNPTERATFTNFNLRSSLRNKKEWQNQFQDFTRAFDLGRLDEALSLAANLILEGERLRIPTLELTFICERGATAAMGGPGDPDRAEWFCERGMQLSQQLPDPTASLTRAQILLHRALIAQHRADATAAYGYLQASSQEQSRCESYRSKVLGKAARAGIDESGIRHRLTAGALLQAMGRWDEALDRIGTAWSVADKNNRQALSLQASCAAGLLLLGLGNAERVGQVLDNVMPRMMSDLEGLPKPAQIEVFGAIAFMGTWMLETSGSPGEAVDVLVSALADLATFPYGWNATRRWHIQLVARLAALHLAAGNTVAAARVLEPLEPEDLLAAMPHGDLLQSWLYLLRSTVGPERALDAMSTFDQRHGIYAMAPHEAVAVLPALAADAAVIGEPGQALDLLERATAAMAWICGGRMIPEARAATQTTRQFARDQCLRIAAGVAFTDHSRAGRLALRCADAWRENTLATAVATDLGALPAKAQNIIQKIEIVTTGNQTSSLGQFSTVTQPAMSAEAQRAGASEVASLREQLGQEIGVAMAQVLTPTPRASTDLTQSPNEVLLSATALDGGATVIASWQLPGSAAGVQQRTLGPAAVDLVRDLAAGLTFPTGTAAEVRG
ncbi:MAG: hypothetical protein INR62_04340, partial [Rhodospirillales bacterium]|nr:hypothetical protein [Acetobacter sp.]